MGCGGCATCGRNQNLISEIKDIKTLKEQIRALYKADPFHLITLSTFVKYLKPQLNKKESKTSNNTEPTFSVHNEASKREIIEKKVNDICTPLEISNVTQSILIDLFMLSGDKLHSIFPNSNMLNEYYDEVIMMFFLFNCTEKYKENKDEKIKMIHKLLDFSKESNSEYYITGKLSFIILSFACFCMVTLLYTYLSIITLKMETNDTLTQKEMEDLFINKKDIEGVCCKDVGEIVKKHLNMLKDGIEPLSVQQKLLVYCFQPISAIIIENPDIPKIKLTKTEYNKIAEKMIYMFNIKHFPGLFLE